MDKLTKYNDRYVITLYRTSSEVILGKSEHIYLYVNAYDYDNDNELKKYYYDECDGAQYVIELGEFESIESAEKSFAEEMKYMANEYYDGIIELYV